MTGSSQFFSSRIPCLGNSKVRIADGSLSTVAGKGTIKLENCLTLFSVLHVPNLKCNLLSVSKFTKDTNCVAKFGGFKRLFSNPILGRMIGNAKNMRGYIISRIKDL